MFVEISSLFRALHLSGSKLELKSFVSVDRVASPSIAGYLVCMGGQWCHSVRSARFEPALNGYLEESREDK